MTGSGPDPIDGGAPGADPDPMITAIRPRRSSARQPATPSDRPGRFGARRPSAPAASGYVVDPEAVAAALVERLLAGRAFAVRAKG